MRFWKTVLLGACVLIAGAFGSIYGYCGHPVQFLPRAPASWRTAFVGDSITAFWGTPAVNFGHPGYTTQALLLVFQQRVQCRCYRNLVILGGTNDILQGVDPASTVANLRTMIRRGRDQSAEVFVGTVPPMYGRFEGHGREIADLNRRIASLAKEEGATLLDFNAALTGHPDDLKDGIHPNATGYLAMDSVLRQNGLLR